MDPKDETSYTSWGKRLKKYALIGLSAVSLLGLKSDSKSHSTDSPSPAPSITRTAEPEMDISQKIDYIVENMLETDVDSSAEYIDLLETPQKKISSPEKKAKIRQNLQTYISVPLGHELLSKLDVTKISFVDTLTPEGRTKGQLLLPEKVLIHDFEDLTALSVLHHELTHALQYQQNGITARVPLNEIDAHLNQTKYFQQASSMGTPIAFIDKLNLNVYKTYNGRDLEYIQREIYPELISLPHYREAFIRGMPNTENDFRSYAQSLGFSKKEAKAFAKALNSERIETTRDTDHGTLKMYRNPDGKTIEETFDPNGNKIETIKRFMDPEGKMIEETFGPDNNKTKTVKKFKDPNGRRTTETFGPDDKKIQAVTSFPDGKTIEETFGPDEKRIEAVTSFKDQDENWVHIVEKDKKIQKYVNGQLVETIKSEQKENSSQNPTNSFQSTETPINSNANTATNSSPLLTFFKDHAAHTFPSENTTTNLVKLSHSSTNAPKPKESKPLSSIKTPKFFDSSR